MSGQSNNGTRSTILTRCHAEHVRLISRHLCCRIQIRSGEQCFSCDCDSESVRVFGVRGFQSPHRPKQEPTCNQDDEDEEGDDDGDDEDACREHDISCTIIVTTIAPTFRSVLPVHHSRHKAPSSHLFCFSGTTLPSAPKSLSSLLPSTAKHSPAQRHEPP